MRSPSNERWLVPDWGTENDPRNGYFRRLLASPAVL